MNRKQKLRLVVVALKEHDDEQALMLLEQALLDKKRLDMRTLVLKFSHESNLGGVVSIYYYMQKTLYCFQQYRGGTFKLIDCNDYLRREVAFERIKIMDLPDNPQLIKFMRLK